VSEQATTANGTALGRTVRLTIPAKPEYITLSRLALAGLSRVRDFSDETLADLKLALTEACSNSVRHAYRDGEGPRRHQLRAP
jgi:anti-sigma regulatory factor (Ser/Thr protein kinase)